MDLNIAEIPFEDGQIHFRYARYLADDGERWIRHGPFFCYYPNGAVASERQYVDGHEQGLWTDYHPNGQKAAQGNYDRGQEHGVWKYWDADGSPSEGQSR